MPICNYELFTSLPENRNAAAAPGFLWREYSPTSSAPRLTTASHLKGQMFNKKLAPLNPLRKTSFIVYCLFSDDDIYFPSKVWIKYKHIWIHISIYHGDFPAKCWYSLLFLLSENIAACLSGGDHNSIPEAEYSLMANIALPLKISVSSLLEVCIRGLRGSCPWLSHANTDFCLAPGSGTAWSKQRGYI